ncbi:MAG: hypothetical protein ACREAK_03805 [Nitrosarchaeum sp.]
MVQYCESRLNRSGGTRHQVEIAIRQGKIVMVPEPLQDNKVAYEGFEKFVELGAKPVKSIDDVFTIMKEKNSIYKNTTLLEFPEV